MNSLKKLFGSLFGKLNSEESIGYSLSSEQKIELKVPEEILKSDNWKVSEWYVQVGDKVKPGDVLCKIESTNQESTYESFVKGRINYRNISNTNINKDTILVEIIGE